MLADVEAREELVVTGLSRLEKACDPFASVDAWVPLEADGPWEARPLPLDLPFEAPLDDPSTFRFLKIPSSCSVVQA